MAEEQNEVEVTTPVGKLRARGTDLIAVLIVVALSANGVIQYNHMEDAKSAASTATATNKEVAGAIKEVVKAQRQSTCILATDADKREQEYMKQNSFCNRISQ